MCANLYLRMSKAAVIAFVIFSASPAAGQTAIRATKPVCAPGAICFSGRVADGEEFRKNLTPELGFVLEPGWTITIVPKRPADDCKELASVVNGPYRAHRSLYIDMSYGVPAEAEVTDSPREFRFVINCADYRTESARLDIVLWPYTATQEQYGNALAKLGTSALGNGRLWITDSAITHKDDTPDRKQGKIEWMKFTVEIKLPHGR
jgi:hypothetical protein